MPAVELSYTECVNIRIPALFGCLACHACSMSDKRFTMTSAGDDPKKRSHDNAYTPDSYMAIRDAALVMMTGCTAYEKKIL